MTCEGDDSKHDNPWHSCQVGHQLLQEEIKASERQVVILQNNFFLLNSKLWSLTSCTLQLIYWLESMFEKHNIAGVLHWHVGSNNTEMTLNQHLWCMLLCWKHSFCPTLAFRFNPLSGGHCEYLEMESLVELYIKALYNTVYRKLCLSCCFTNLNTQTWQQFPWNETLKHNCNAQNQQHPTNSSVAESC